MEQLWKDKQGTYRPYGINVKEWNGKADNDMMFCERVYYDVNTIYIFSVFMLYCKK